MGVAVVHSSLMGRTLMDADIKAYLCECNPDIHFDMGVNLNIWSPSQHKWQGVFYRGKHIVAMDRGVISENAIWSVKRSRVSKPACDLSYAQMTDPMTFEEFLTDDKGLDVPTGTYSIEVQERDRIIFVGWRHTLRRVITRDIPGVTKEGLERKFGINLDYIPIEEIRRRGAELATEQEAEKSKIVIATS